MQNSEGKNFIIGVTGSFSSGCSTISKYIASKGLVKLSLADKVKDKKETDSGILSTLKKEFEKYGYFLEDSERQILQSVGNYLCIDSSDPKHLASFLIDKINQNEHSYVVNGFRRPAEVKAFKDKFGDCFYLLGVDCDIVERKARYFADCRAKGNLVPDEKLDIYFAFEEQRDRCEYNIPESFRQNVQKCYQQSDYVIHNEHNQSIKFDEGYNSEIKSPCDLLTADTKRHIDRFIDLITTTTRVTPEAEEYAMAHAFLATLKSRCEQRHVGASLFKANVILRSDDNTDMEKIDNEDENKDEKSSELVEILMTDELISVGYNAPPPTYSENGEMEDCVSRGKCHRKEFVKRTKSEVKCAKCDKVIESDICIHCMHQNEVEMYHPRWLDECLSIHAEERAILEIGKKYKYSSFATVLFTTTYPCTLCAKKICEVGIDKIIYMEPYPMKSAVKILNNASVETQIYTGISPKSINRLIFGNKHQKIPE